MKEIFDDFRGSMTGNPRANSGFAEKSHFLDINSPELVPEFPVVETGAWEYEPNEDNEDYPDSSVRQIGLRQLNIQEIVYDHLRDNTYAIGTEQSLTSALQENGATGIALYVYRPSSNTWTSADQNSLTDAQFVGNNLLSNAVFYNLGSIYAITEENSQLVFVRWIIEGDSNVTRQTIRTIEVPTNRTDRVTYHVHSDGDIYFTHNSVAYRFNPQDSTFEADVFPLIGDFVFSTVTQYDNDVAFGVYDTTNDASRLIVWDGNEELRIGYINTEWCKGFLYHLHTLNGRLLGISSENLENQSSVTNNSGNRGIISIRAYIGNSNVEELNFIKTNIIPDTLSGLGMIGDSFKTDGQRVFFSASIPATALSNRNSYVENNGNPTQAVFSFDANGVLLMPVRSSNADIVNSGKAYRGFHKVNNRWWIIGNVSIEGGSESYVMSTTVDSVSVVDESRLTTNLIDGTRRGLSRASNKQFEGLEVSVEPFTSNLQRIIIEYKRLKDEQWVQLYDLNRNSEGIADRLRFFVNNVATSIFFNEIQFRVISKGGAVITSFGVYYKPHDDSPTK